MTSPRAWQATVDAAVEDVEDEVVEIFFSELSAPSSPASSRFFFFELAVQPGMLTPNFS
jgi:hypothetical protein